MKDSDILTIMGMIRLRYPRNTVLPEFDTEGEALALAINVWRMSLEDTTLPEIQTVLRQWFQTEKWAPDPSEIRMRVINLDGTREKRIAHLQRIYDAGTASPEMKRELAALKAGARYWPEGQPRNSALAHDH